MAHGDDELADLVRSYVARVSGKAAVCAQQRPLLPEDLPPGVVLHAARRSRWCAAEFFGRDPPLQAACAGPEEVGCAECKLVVSETSLVHYIPRQQGERRKAAEAAGKGVGAMGAAEPPVEEKYWKRRYNYFARFDEGIRMDAAAFFEVTPESIARHVADRMQYDTVVDGTAGVGGNAIQFAMRSRRVIAVDMDAGRLRDAEHNAAVYGVRDRMEFVCDDFMHWAAHYDGPPIDAVFLSPPWGGPSHLDAEYFSLKDVEGCDIVGLFEAAVKVSGRVVLYMPRHQDLNEIVLLAAAHGFDAVEVEKIFFQYPTPHLKVCVLHFTPEASTAECAGRTRTSRKTIGPTHKVPCAVRPTRPEAPPARPEAPPASESERLPTMGPVPRNSSAAELLFLPPLAGPLIRALHCRHHYLGRYVVALAIAQERLGEAAAQAAQAGQGCAAQAGLSSRAKRPLSRDPGCLGAARTSRRGDRGRGGSASTREAAP